MRQMAQPGAQEILDHRRRIHDVAAAHLRSQQLLRRQQHLVSRRRAVLPVRVAHQQRPDRSRESLKGFERRKQIVWHDALR
ncbi:MAG: hypothetical protein Q8K24_13675 [Hydrogenophaga sp.]|nr:hypothetical protein [Hydrogenophaga sp.]